MNNPYVQQYNYDSRIASQEAEVQYLREKINELEYELAEAQHQAKKSQNNRQYYQEKCEAYAKENKKLKEFIEKNG